MSLFPQPSVSRPYREESSNRPQQFRTSLYRLAGIFDLEHVSVGTSERIRGRDGKSRAFNTHLKTVSQGGLADEDTRMRAGVGLTRESSVISGSHGWKIRRKLIKRVTVGCLDPDLGGLRWRACDLCWRSVALWEVDAGCLSDEAPSPATAEWSRARAPASSRLNSGAEYFPFKA